MRKQVSIDGKSLIQLDVADININPGQKMRFPDEVYRDLETQIQEYLPI
jgi:hypothetical protein